MIVEKILERKAAKIKNYPTHTNRASELGHICERYLVFKRTRWQDATLHDVALQVIFDEGHLHEEAEALCIGYRPRTRGLAFESA